MQIALSAFKSQFVLAYLNDLVELSWSAAKQIGDVK